MLEPLLSPWVLLGLFVLLAYTTEAMTGFGSIVIALSLGALVLPLDTLMPVLVPLNLLLSGYLSHATGGWCTGACCYGAFCR